MVYVYKKHQNLPKGVYKCNSCKTSFFFKKTKLTFEFYVKSCIRTSISQQQCNFAFCGSVLLYKNSGVKLNIFSKQNDSLIFTSKTCFQKQNVH